MLVNQLTWITKRGHNMKIGIIGKGTVGDAVYRGLQQQGHQLSFYDVKHPETQLSDVLNTQCVFVCVPTDSDAQGDCDVSIVNSVVAELHTAGYAGLVCIKSTISPGTTDRLQSQYPAMRICCAPEFLRARLALADFVYNHDVLVVGSRRLSDFELIKKIHGFIPRSTVCVKPVEAEITKYFNNVHHAMQVTFANIAYEVCQQLGADYDAVYNAIIKRDCINPHYLQANPNLRGFGGHCLPKDTRAWSQLCEKLGLEFDMIKSIL